MRTTRRRHSMTVVAVLIAVVGLLLTGCSALGGSDDDANPSGDGPEKPTVRVGLLPVVDVASFYIAQERGYFAAEGIDAEPVIVQGGAAAIPGLVSGDLDITFGNWVSFILAQSQGVADFRLISDSYQAKPNMFLVMSRPGPPVSSPADLAGKRVAVNTFNNIAELTTRSALRTNGVDPNSVQFVELAFPDMPAALAQGQVDAAFMVEPFITKSAQTFGAVPILDAASGPTQEIPIAGYGVTGEFAQQNPKTVAAFQRAMARGQQDANDRATVVGILPSYAKIDPATAAVVNLGTYPTSLSATRLQRVADLMREFNVLPGPFDVAPMISAGG